MTYESSVTVQAKTAPGVSLKIRRMSFARRLELTAALKELLGRLEFASAAETSAAQEAEIALLCGQVDREYVRWGVEAVKGLQVDGEPADVERLLESGPEQLVVEAVELVRREAGLSEEERKNSGSHSIIATETRPGGDATSAASPAWKEEGVVDGLTQGIAEPRD